MNLVFIAITQLLFQYCVVVPLFNRVNAPLAVNTPVFIALMAASVLIAAAGYIINDYFDLNIDRINKPDKLVVDKLIKRRWAIIWHLCLSSIGLLLSAWVAWKTRAWWLLPANLFCVAALWFYSTTFKKKLLSGNVIISFLTAWVILVIGFLTHYLILKNSGIYGAVYASKLMRLTFLYAGFAFTTSLVREVVKDMEDIKGDERYGCRTMPIVWGINASKVFAATWLIVLIAAVTILQAYILPYRWYWLAVYSALLIWAPLFWLLRKLVKATDSKQFHQLSSALKLIMLTGIVSMLFFKLYS